MSVCISGCIPCICILWSLVISEAREVIYVLQSCILLPSSSLLPCCSVLPSWAADGFVLIFAAGLAPPLSGMDLSTDWNPFLCPACDDPLKVQ